MEAEDDVPLTSFPPFIIENVVLANITPKTYNGQRVSGKLGEKESDR